MKKLLVVGVIVLFLGVAIAPSINAMFDSKMSDLNEKSGDEVIIFYGYASQEFSKDKLGHNHRHRHIHTSAFYLHFDANVDELNLELILNYSAEMNYTLKFPFVLAPLVAFGLKVENYTDFKWESFKLKHHGYAKCEGNISVEVSLDMENIESGDTIILQPIISLISVPFLSTPDENKSWTWILLLRFLYNIPLVLKLNLLLHNWVLPTLAPYNWFFEGEGAPITLFFH